MTVAPVSETRAIDLFGSLTTDFTVEIPTVDFTAAEYQVPAEADNPLYTAVSAITEADLTTREVGGTGLFDGLMAALSAHLTTEYEQGRITGKEYADAYVAMTQTALSSAVQFLLTKDTAYQQAALTQMQARAAEAAVIAARVETETSKAKLAITQIQAKTAGSDYALSKMKLATEDASYELAKSQEARATYELTYLLPKQVLQIEKQIDIGSAQISEVTAKTEQVLYQTASILPAQKLDVEADTAVKNYQANNLLPAQRDNVIEDTAGKNYTNTFILPERLDQLREQTEAERAKTLDTRSDGATPVTGSIGKQKELYAQQINSYQRDAESKVAKMLLDTWITQKSMDEGLVPPSSLTDANINTVMDKIRTNLSLV